MDNTATNLVARDDTMLGICQALAEDFGFNPLYLRIALSVPLLWSPTLAVGAYAAMGVLVLFSRLVFPNPKPAAAAAAAAPAEPQAEAKAPVEIDMISRQLLPLAA